jgi:hypothetical protein
VAVIKNELPVDELEVMHRHQLAILYNMNVDRARRRNACSSYEEMELNEKSLVRGVRTYFEGMKTLHQVRGPHTQPSFIVQTGPFQIPENQSPLALEARASAAAILPPPCVDEKALSQTSAKAKKITRGGSVEGEAKPLHRVRLPEAMRRADRSRCG